MPTATVLPPLAPFQEISRLLAWLNYLWACYQALLGNYRALQAENAQLRERAAYTEQCAVNVSQRAAHAEKRAAHAEQRAAHAEQRAAYAEQRAAYAERCADHRRNMNNDLHEEISNLEFRVEDAKNDAAEAEQRADEAEQRAYDAENELNALYEQQHVENQILRELSNDGSWTSVSKGNFVNKQTRLVMEMTNEVKELKSKLETSTDFCERLVNSVSQLFRCPIELGVPESNPVLCVGIRNGPAFVLSAETAKNLKGKHPLLHGEGFVPRTLSGLEDTIKVLLKTKAQNELLAKSLQL
jgi:hypothetical protein